MCASTASRRPNRSGRPEAIAAAATACSDAATLPTSWRRAVTGSINSGRPSSQGADLLFQHAPSLRAVLLLPFLVEAGAAQRGAECLRIGGVEYHAFLGEPGLNRLVELGDVRALVERGGIDVPG